MGAYVHHWKKHAGGAQAKRLDFDSNTQAGTDNNGQPVTFRRSTTGWARPRASVLMFSTGAERSEPHAQGVCIPPQPAGRGENPADAGGAGTGARHSGQYVLARHQRAPRSRHRKTSSPICFSSEKKPRPISYAGRSRAFRMTRSLSSRERRKCDTGPHRLHKLLLTGPYVNANHVLVFQDANVAGHYDQVYEKSWQVLSNNRSPSKPAAAAFSSTNLATQPFDSQPASVPKMDITSRRIQIPMWIKFLAASPIASSRKHIRPKAT